MLWPSDTAAMEQKAEAWGVWVNLIVEVLFLPLPGEMNQFD